MACMLAGLGWDFEVITPAALRDEVLALPDPPPSQRDARHPRRHHGSAESLSDTTRTYSGPVRRDEP